MTNEEYKNFMYNPDNIGKCGVCPSNDGWPDDPCSLSRRYPCGQNHCWVRLSCESVGKA
jgi:hypothetical protein